MRLALLATALAMAATPVRADSADDAGKAAHQAADAWEAASKICLSTMGDEQRKCFQALIPAMGRFKAIAEKMTEASKGNQAPVAAASAPEAPTPAAEAPKKLSAADIGVETSKWNGKYVEVTFQCFYADRNEFRCTAGTGRVDFSDLTPPAEREKLENDCGTIANMQKLTCRRAIRFFYRESKMVEAGGLLGRMNLVRAFADRGEIVGPTPKRR